MTNDEQHLKLLSIFHYVVAGMTACTGCLPIIHLVIGMAALSGKLEPSQNGREEVALMGWLFTGFASVAIVAMWSLAVVVLFAGRFLQQRRRPTYCLVVAALECLWMPFGTVLGVFTIVVLMRPSVQQLFADGGGAPVSGS
jgi:hypothetical protein